MNNSILIRRSCLITLVFSMLACSSICSGQAINWFPDTGSAARAAADQNKIILLNFGAQWCQHCDQLNTYVYSDSTVQRAFAEDLIAVNVDVDKQPNLVEEFGVTAVPTVVAITPEGQILASRKSPNVVASYLKMISDFKTTRSKLEDPNAHIENAAYQIQQAQNGFQAQTASFTPEFPYQAPTQPAESSQQLKNQSRVVKNPFVQSAGSGTKQVAARPHDPSAPLTLPAPIQMPGQLSMPGQLKMPAEMKMSSVEGQLTVAKNAAKSVPARNLALKRLDQSDIAARLVREQAEEKLANFRADPKSVTDDRFYGNHSAKQPANAIAGNYQAKINLPQSAVGFVPPQPPSFGSQTASNVMGRGVSTPGTRARLASSPVSILKKPGDGDAVQRGLEKASATPVEPNYALHGKCPVSLLTKSKWIDGEEEIGCVHRNRIYIFSSEENLQTFQSDPDAYSPILAGYDPVIFEETGRLVDGLEEYGVFMGKTPKQRIVLFASPETRARFQLEPRRYLNTVRQAMDKSSSTTR